MASKFAKERGHEEARFELPVNENLKCSICLNVLNNPKSCRNNQHYFCFGCIGQHLENSHTCPECMEELTPATLVEPPRVLLNMILALRIRCNHGARGCPEYVQLDRLQNHVDQCGFGPTTCGNEGCGAIVNRSDKVRHETELCKFRTIECSGCEELKKQVDELKRNQEMARKNTEEKERNFVEKQRELDDKKKEIDKKQREMDQKQGDMERKMAEVIENQLKMKEAVKKALKEGACKIEEIFNDVQIDSEPPTKPHIFLSPQSHGFRINFDVILMGGESEDEKVLNSVEMYASKEGRWIDLPPMVIPRTSASAVLHENQVIVTGGKTNLDTSKEAKMEPTDSIEILNLERRPLRWEISYAKLPCPLAGHQTFIYKGKLLVVSSKMIFQISLSPDHEIKELYNLDELRSPFKAELVNEGIFIFQSNYHFPREVLVYDLLANECQEMPCLPVIVSGMSTVVCGDKIILLGGRKKFVTGNRMKGVEDSDDVIVYDTKTGESEMLPAMKHPRSGSAAVLNDDVIVVMAGYFNSVEFFDIRTNSWQALRALKRKRGNATAIVSPVRIT